MNAGESTIEEVTARPAAIAVSSASSSETTLEKVISQAAATGTPLMVAPADVEKVADAAKPGEIDWNKLPIPNVRVNGKVKFRPQVLKQLQRKAAHVKKPRKPLPLKTAGLREKQRQRWTNRLTG